MADFKLIEKDTLPETLAENAAIIYDGQIWIGNSSNEPFPAKGYKEWVAFINQDGTSAPTAVVISSDFSDAPTITRSDVGRYNFRSDDIVEDKTDANFSANNILAGVGGDSAKIISFSVPNSNQSPGSSDLVSMTIQEIESAGSPTFVELSDISSDYDLRVSIKVYN